MKKIQSLLELKESIRLLELQQNREWNILKQQMNTTYESLKPVNLISSTFHDLIKAPGFTNDLVDTTLGVTTGYLSRKAAIGSSHNPIKQFLGALLQVGITTVVTRNTSGIKSALMYIIKNALTTKHKSPN